MFRTFTTILLGSFLIMSTPKAQEAMYSYKPVVCALFANLQKNLREEYKEKEEKLLGISEDQDLIIIQFHNENTFSIVEVKSTGYGCIVSSGVFPGKKIPGKDTQL